MQGLGAGNWKSENGKWKLEREGAEIAYPSQLDRNKEASEKQPSDSDRVGARGKQRHVFCLKRRKSRPLKIVFGIVVCATRRGTPNGLVVYGPGDPSLLEIYFRETVLSVYRGSIERSEILCSDCRTLRWEPLEQA